MDTFVGWLIAFALMPVVVVLAIAGAAVVIGRIPRHR
jgi:hypothetical protein